MIRNKVCFVYHNIKSIVSVLFYVHYEMHNMRGWTSKPKPRSETARLRSNVFKGFGNDDIFLIRACIVMMFKNNAVKSKKALKKQLATRVE